MTNDEIRKTLRSVYDDGGAMTKALGDYAEATERLMAPFVAVIVGPDEAKADAAIALLANTIAKDAP